jgi:hypothetical protein
MSNTLSNKERTKWKILSFSLMGILIASTTTAAILFHSVLPALNGSVTGQQLVNAPSLINAAYGAGVLTNVFALPADNLFSTKTYYTIAFTTATIGAIREIEMTFPAGFNVASAKLLEVQGGIGAGSLSVSGQVVKYTVSSPVSIPAQRAIKISIADITNSATTSNQVAVTTKAFSGPNIVIVDGPTNSATFTLVQVSNAMLTSNAVTASKLAVNSVDNTKIQDGTIGKAEISTAFIKKVTIPDQNTGSTDWDPNGARKEFFIIDTSLKRDSIISINLYPNSARNACIGMPQAGAELVSVIQIWCNYSPYEGQTLTYLLVN